MAILATLLALFIATTLGASLIEPATIDLIDGSFIVLEVRKWRFVSQPSGMINFTTRAWCYQGNCSIPGPTLLFHPGTTVTIEVNNTLAAGQPTSYTANTYHSPDTVNLHTHGLHVSPSEDDVLTEIVPESARNYTYNIPYYHYEGTHWYHTHFHGSTHFGVSGGLTGMLLMERHSSVVGDTDWDAVSSTVIHILPMTVTTACSSRRRLQPPGGGGGGGGGSVFTEVPLCEAHHQMNYQSWTWDAASNATVVLINGQEQPTLDITTGAWHRLRLLNSGSTFWLEIELTGCSMLLLGFDGVFFDTPRTVTYIVMNQGKRADVAVQCSTAGTYSLTTNPSNARSLGPALRHPLTTLMYINVAGTAVSMTQPANPPAKPDYLASTLAMNLASSYTWELRGGGVNNVVYPGTYAMNFSIGSTVHWTVSSNWHPYHHHIHHYQLQADISESTTVIAKAGDWVDNLSAPGSYAIRFHAVTFNGSLVLHCHFLDHEDKGMMAKALMIGAENCPGCGSNYVLGPTGAPVVSPTTSPITTGPTAVPTAGPAVLGIPTMAPTSGCHLAVVKLGFFVCVAAVLL